MSLTRSTFLLFLGVLVTPLYAEAQDVCKLSPNLTSINTNYMLTVSPENLTNGTVYTVTLSSKVNASVQVLLQAMANNIAVGTWSVTNTSSDCTGGFGVSYTLSTSTSLHATWTSPSNLSVNSLNISALINDNTTVYMAEKTLSANAAAPMAPNATAAPMAPNATAAPMAPNATAAPMAPKATAATMAPNATAATMAPNATAAPMAPNSTAATMAPNAPAAPIAPNAAAATTATTVTIHATKTTSWGHANNPASWVPALCLLLITSKLLS